MFLDSPVASSKNCIKLIVIHLIRIKFPVIQVIYSVVKKKKKQKKKHDYPTDLQYIFHMVTEEMLLPTAIVTEWSSIAYYKISNFFIGLIFLVSYPP